eukprot:2397979-Rhodomonas_salina.5
MVPQVAVVTGGASGIGYALASKCLREGMQLLLSDVNEGLLRSAAETLSQKHQCEIETLVVDVRDEKQVRALLDRCMVRPSQGCVATVCSVSRSR